MESMIKAVQFLLRRKITHGDVQEATEATDILQALDDEVAEYQAAVEGVVASALASADKTAAEASEPASKQAGK
jgi:hypothetical protein